MARGTRWGFLALTWLGAGLAAWALEDARAPGRVEPEAAPAARPHPSVPAAPASDAGVAEGGRPRGPRTGRLAWSFTTGGRITGPVATDAAGVYVSSHDGHLYALDRAGRLRWQRDLGAASYSGVAVDARGRLYVGTEDAALQVVSPRGQLLHRYPAAGAVDRVPVPARQLGVLFVGGRELRAVLVPQAPGPRFAAHRKIFTRPALGADGPYLGAQDHLLYALDWQLRPRWQRELGADVDGAPVVAPDGTVVAGADDGRVHAFAFDGVPRWSVALGGAIRAPLALSGDGRVLVQVQGVEPALVCLDLADGSLRFRHRLSLEDSPGAGSRSGPVVDADGVVYAGAYDDRIVALDADGGLVFERRTRGHVHADVVLDADGTLYVGADDGVLYALRD
jgi:outer membrane protein assembly factor BamB